MKVSLFVIIKASRAPASIFLMNFMQNILASNWQAQLHTIKADTKGSKGDVYSSKVKYIVRKGKPYIWVWEKDLHNVNTVIDERGSLAVTSPFPGPLASILKSTKKLPSRIALIGDVLPLKEQKVPLAAESLKEVMSSEQKAIRESSYAVTGVLTSANLVSTSCSENLRELIDADQNYIIYKFDIRSCMFIDNNGANHEVELENIKASKTDVLAPYSAMLIDGINQSELRRKALVLFCLSYFGARARDAFMLSLDRKGFDVLAKVPSTSVMDASQQFHWKEYRFTLKYEAQNIESFCSQLVEMEEEAIKKVSSYSGLG